MNLPKPSGYTYMCGSCGGNVHVPHGSPWPERCHHCYVSPLQLHSTGGHIVKKREARVA